METSKQKISMAPGFLFAFLWGGENGMKWSAWMLDQEVQIYLAGNSKPLIAVTVPVVFHSDKYVFWIFWITEGTNSLTKEIENIHKYTLGHWDTS